MQIKDFAGIVISAVALIVSLGVAIYTSRAANYQEAATMLDQLNTVLKDITASMVDINKLAFEFHSKDAQYFNRILYPGLRQQLGALVSQAMFLTDQKLIKHKVSSVQLNTIAQANAYLEQLTEAKDYFLNAITAAEAIKDNVAKARSQARAMQSYAGFLFTQNAIEDGRKQYDAALKLLQELDSDTDHMLKGEIYKQWALLEREKAKDSQNKDSQDKGLQEAESHFNHAETEYNAIRTHYIRDRRLNDLNLIRYPASTRSSQAELDSTITSAPPIRPNLQTPRKGGEEAFTFPLDAKNADV